MNVFVRDMVSMEGIRRQSEDKLVDSLLKDIATIRVLSMDGKLRDPDKANKDRIVRKTFDSIEDSLSERFGVRYRVLASEIEAAIYFSPHSDTSSVGYGNEEYINVLRTWFEDTDLTNINMENITRSNEYASAAIYKNALEIKKKLTRDGKVYIDEKNAVVKGLEGLYAGIINVNFDTLFRYKLSDREVAAIIMHEVGHGFMSFSELNKSANSVVTTMESLMAVKGDEKATISLVNESFGIQSKDSKELLFEIVKQMTTGKQHGYVITNNEATADQFAARFGLGADIVTSLSKLHGIYDGSYIPYSSTSVSVAIISIYVIITSIVTGVAAAALMVLFVTVVISAFYLLFLAISSGSNISNMISFTYDDLVDRFNRIKKDNIRQLRTMNLSNKEIKSILKDISVIEIEIKKSKKYFSISSISKMFTYLKTSRDGMQMREFFTGIEDLLENDFHYQKEKFKTIKV